MADGLIQGMDAFLQRRHVNSAMLPADRRERSYRRSFVLL